MFYPTEAQNPIYGLGKELRASHERKRPATDSMQVADRSLGR